MIMANREGGLREEVEYHSPVGQERPAQPPRISLGLSALRASPGVMAHYRRRRDDHGDWHAAAQRHLFNRMIGQLYRCL